MSSDPYDVLGVSREDDDATIRRRYLELVRRHSPERDPERFSEIRAAYEKIRDPVERMKSQLFELKRTDALDMILAEMRTRLRNSRIPTKALLSLAERQ